MRKIDRATHLRPRRFNLNQTLLEGERTWCWGSGGAAIGGKGGLTLNDDGSVTAFGGADVPRRGRWRLEDDGRVEVVLPRDTDGTRAQLHHFDVGETGRLGVSVAGGREDLNVCAPSSG